MTDESQLVDLELSAYLSPSDLSHYMLAMIEANQPLMIWGGPGTSKSDLARQIADAIQHVYHAIHPLLMERIDLLGIPFIEVINEMNRTSWASPGFLPDPKSTEAHLINIEEITAAKEDMQSALYQLILERRVGQYFLPPKARLIACGNRYTDRGAVHKMPAPLASRFTHVEIKPAVSDWVEWALDHDIDTDVIFFIRFFGEKHLNAYIPTAKEIPFPCPRTWEQVSRIKPHIQHLRSDIQRTSYIGTVGLSAGSDFWSFLEIKKDLPDPMTIIIDPENAPIGNEPSAQIMLCSALYRMADQFNFGSICTYAQRMQHEFAHFLITQSIRRDADLTNTEAYSRWAARNNTKQAA